MDDSDDDKKLSTFQKILLAFPFVILAVAVAVIKGPIAGIAVAIIFTLFFIISSTDNPLPKSYHSNILQNVGMIL